MSETMQNQFVDETLITWQATKPGQLRIIKRTGQLVPYDDSKISVAMTQAFLAVDGKNAAVSSRIRDTVQRLTQYISSTLSKRNPSGGTLHIEDIQDQVELALMRAGEREVARTYVLYREERRKEREEAAQSKGTASTHELQVTLSDGSRQLLDKARLATLISEACEDLTAVDHNLIITETLRNLYDGVPIAEVYRAAIMSARTLIEGEPNYTYVSARLLLDTLRSEALTFLGIADRASAQDMTGMYPVYFKRYIDKGIECGLLDPMLKQYDLTKLGAALKPERDTQFTYLGLQTLYDRYFLHSDKTRFELPQAFFMRVAMGLASAEKNDKEKWAIEFYNLLSSFDFMSSTPTLFNSGTLHPQLSSCYLTTIQDSLEDICDSLKKNCLLSKYAGGLGNDWSYIRSMGSHIAGTNGESLGPIPFMNMFNAAAVAVNQGGKRKGAVCGYMETTFGDSEEFQELRKNTGDERRRTHDMNTANWIPDLFMQRVFEEGEWSLFSADETAELHDLYGLEFEKAYLAYEERAKAGQMKYYKTIPALKMWRKMLSMLFETGHPWVTFKDVCNIRSPQQHVGVVHSSNLCTEITLNTSKDEIAVCNLGSINLPAHIENGKLNLEKLRRTITLAIRMLDNVIDYNFYPVIEARNSNMRHRPIGLGVMGFQDALYELRIPYASDNAVEFADVSMEHISYFAIEASSALAKERGQYETFPGSLWHQGILPIDSINLVAKARNAGGKDYFRQNTTQRLDWNKLRELVKTQGMRNSNVLAIAPTATIANICGVTQSIEPTYQNLFVKSNLSGEFTVVNPHLVNDLKALNLWDEVMANDLKYFDGNLRGIERVPAELKELYATAFEIDPMWLVEAGSRRQKWIDQSQSLNLYMAQPSGKKLDTLYRSAWLMGLKTTYYLRTMGASHSEKSTISDTNLNAVIAGTTSANVCSIDNPDCEACQ
jgi:ribonucleoside-diphosphate reductase alpha chain